MTAPSSIGHAYRLGLRGRHFEYPAPDERNGSHKVVATIQCTLCRRFGTMKLKKELPDHSCDNRFTQRGWKLDPHICPKCSGEEPEDEEVAESQGDKTMSIPTDTPTPVAAKAQRQLHALLDQHFDEEKGLYRDDWSDKRIAEETGLAVAHVAHVRDNAYGPLAERPEVKNMRADINDMQIRIQNMRVDLDQMEQAVAQMRHRLSKLER